MSVFLCLLHRIVSDFNFCMRFLRLLRLSLKIRSIRSICGRFLNHFGPFWTNPNCLNCLNCLMLFFLPCTFCTFCTFTFQSADSANSATSFFQYLISNLSNCTLTTWCIQHLNPLDSLHFRSCIWRAARISYGAQQIKIIHVIAHKANLC